MIKTKHENHTQIIYITRRKRETQTTTISKQIKMRNKKEKNKELRVKT